MRSAVADLLPSRLRKSLAKLGSDLSLARRKRGLTVAMMAERVGIGVATYRRIERGDPAAAIGAYAMAIYVLGLGEPFGRLVDPGADDTGLALDAARVPKRVRVRKVPTAS